jgi:hypothetical protein
MSAISTLLFKTGTKGRLIPCLGIEEVVNIAISVEVVMHVTFRSYDREFTQRRSTHVEQMFPNEIGGPVSLYSPQWMSQWWVALTSDAR